MVDAQSIFWNKDFTEITEIRYLDVDGEVTGVSGEEAKNAPLMQSTGFKETESDRQIFEGDLVKVEYQYGISTCVVEWCDVKYALILNPIDGEKPRHKPHFRLSGKKSVKIVGNIYENQGLIPPKI